MLTKRPRLCESFNAIQSFAARAGGVTGLDLSERVAGSGADLIFDTADWDVCHYCRRCFGGTVKDEHSLRTT